MRQPPSRSTVRPIQRVNALPPLRGASRRQRRNDRPHSRSQPRKPRVTFTCERSCLPVRRRSFDHASAGWHALLRHERGRLDQRRQALARVLAVAILGAEALRGNHHHALAGDAAIAAREQARTQVLGHVGELAASKRNSTAVATLLTFCRQDRWNARSARPVRRRGWRCGADLKHEAAVCRQVRQKQTGTVGSTA